jgi:hypothetical protein
MTNTGFFGQPIERSLLIFQQLIDPDLDHSQTGLPSDMRYLS